MIKNDDTYSNVSSDEFMLYIGGVGTILTNQLPLYINTDGALKALSLYTRGAGVYPSANISRDDLLMYANRPNETASLGLVAYNNTPGSNTYTSLYMNAILGTETKSCMLVMPNTKDGTPNGYVRLFAQGGIPVVDSTTLALPDVVGGLNANTPLVVFHSGGAPNAPLTLWLDGIYGSSMYTTIAIPNVIGNPVDNCKLFISGY